MRPMSPVARVSTTRVAAAAALIALLIVLFWWWQGNTNQAPVVPQTRVPPTMTASPKASGAAGREGESGRRLEDAGEVTPAPSEIAPVQTTLVPWGSGPGQLGRAQDHVEGEAELPVSFAVDPTGNLQILDKANRRIVQVGPDGAPRGTLPLPGEPEQVIATAADGSLLVVNAGDTRQLQVVEPDGTVRAELPITGSSGDDEHDVTSVFTSGDEVFVGYRGRDPMHIGDLDGNTVANPEPAPGQPSRDGRTFVSVGITDPTAGRLAVTVVERDPQRHRFTRQLTFPFSLHGIFFVDTDAAGEIYVGMEGVPPGGNENEPRVYLACLEPETGSLLGLKSLPANGAPALTFRDAKVTDAGEVIYSVWTPDGMRFERHQCP